MTPLSKLQARQTEAALAHWRNAQLPARPRDGWLRTIRNALSMSARALGERVNVTEAAIRNFEAAETSDAITLASLRKVAAAMGCELQYALVPRVTLTQQLRVRALERARELMAPVSHSMALEAQQVTGDEHAAQIELLADALLEGDRRKLW